MNVADLTRYRQEIKYFLMSMSIKYTPISDLFNEKVAALGYPVKEDDPLCWKYYLNLQGCYHPIDTTMTIRSLDTSETVPFTKEMLRTNNATRRAYVPGSPFYTTLVNRYPEQANLIRSIVYPVTDIEKMLDAPDLTLLQYNENALEPLEQSVLVQDLEDHLDFIRERWYQKFLDMEIFYPMAFWGSLWQNLAGALFTFRTSYIRTFFAHNFHIESFLESRNINVIKDTLTRNQLLFLYRNIDYILDNRGKQSTLDILIRNLLNEDSLGLVNKTISQNTINSEENACRWTPEFVSSVIPENDENIATFLPVDTVQDIYKKLANAGLENDTSEEHIADQTRQMGATTFNKLPTKILEIKRFDQVFTKERLFWNFTVDTFIYSLVHGHHKPHYRVQDKVTGFVVSLDGLDILFLLHYIVGRIFGQKAETLPTYYMPQFVYKENITEEDVPDTFYFDGYGYPMKQFIDVPKWIEDLDYPDNPLVGPSRFVNHTVGMFDTFIYQYQLSRLTSSALTQRAYHVAFDAITQNETMALSPNIVMYEDWIDAKESLRNIIDAYEKSDKMESFYTNFAKDLFDMALPTTPVTSKYVDLNTEARRHAFLTDIFRQLTSYHVAFLDSGRGTQIWAPLTKTSYFVHLAIHEDMAYFRNEMSIFYRDRTYHRLEQNLSKINLFLDSYLYMNTMYEILDAYTWEELRHHHDLYYPSHHGITPQYHQTTTITYPSGPNFAIDTETPT